MNVAKLICDKRDGAELPAEQIHELVQGYAAGNVPDYQMSAFAMAVLFQGMTLDETTALTEAMIASGDVIQWPDDRPAVDKHSTGGIGDKISIVLAPLLACCDVNVPMISGRGLGATGGTLDKLDAIPGYRSEISIDEFRSIVSWNQCSIAGATASIAPADKKLYALRDVTGTVPSVPLITASILSKKLAEGIDALILDVKWGSGAFMKTREQARELANRLVTVSNRLGVKTSAVITDMNQPLGQMIGNAVEIDECVDVLKGQGPQDVRDLTIELGAHLLVQTGMSKDIQDAKTSLNRHIESGAGLQRLIDMVRSHGGDLNQHRDRAASHEIKAADSGFVTRIDARRLGLSVIEMGGGRKKLGDKLDYSVGIEVLVKLGDQVKAGQVIARIFCPPQTSHYAKELVNASFTLDPSPITAPSLIVETIS